MSVLQHFVTFSLSAVWTLYLRHPQCYFCFHLPVVKLRYSFYPLKYFLPYVKHTLSPFKGTSSRGEKNSPNILEREDSLLFPQYPATYPYPEPNKSNTGLPIFLLEDRFLIISNSLGIRISSVLSSSYLQKPCIYTFLFFPLRLSASPICLLLDLTTWLWRKQMTMLFISNAVFRNLKFLPPTWAQVSSKQHIL